MASDAETLPMTPGEPGSSDRMSVGMRFGRYVILREVGNGGAGEVYAAFDPNLDRRIALKVLHPRHHPEHEHDEWATLLAEARALARLSHPNVVAVHDVGVEHDRAYVAMELVDGHDMATWLRTPRSIAEILPVFLAAGRGLAAAHARGIVHRDFKPKNVLLADDGAVKVVDFGLARALEQSHTTDASASEPTPSGEDTAAGLVGTPAYMAPEQHEGHAVDERADQWAFSTSLWEALAGRRPFHGSVFAMAEQKHEAPPVLPRSTAAPKWLADLVARGMAPDPHDRFATMADLLAQLDRGDPGRKRRRQLAIAAGAVGLLVLGASGGAWRVASADACSGAEPLLQEVWDDERREAVASALRGVPAPYASATSDAVIARLDERGTAWATMHREACEATVVRKEQSVELMDLRIACLRSGLQRHDALATMLADADADVLEHAMQAVDELPELSACAEAEALRSALPPPTDIGTRAAVDELRVDLARVESALGVGRYAAALAEASALSDRARTIDHPPARLEVQHALGRSLSHTGAYREALAALEPAYGEALRIGYDELAARIAVEITDVLAGRLEDHAAARQWALHAQALAERVDADGVMVARVELSRAAALRQAGSFDAADAEIDRAEARLDRVLPVSHRLHAGPDIARGMLRLAQGRPREALETFGRARDTLETALGSGHPKVAAALGDIATAHHRLREHEEGVAWQRQALAMLEAALGDEHPKVADMRTNLAAGLAYTGKDDEAIPLLESSLALKQKLYPDDALALVRPLINLGTLLTGVGRAAEARAHLERALRIQEEELGPENPEIIPTLMNLGSNCLQTADRAPALAAYQRALALAEATFEAPHEQIATMQFAVGNVLLALERREEALAIYAEAAKGFAGLDESHAEDEAMVLVGTAFTLEELGRERESGEAFARAVDLGLSPMLRPWEQATARLGAARWLWSDPSQRGRALELAHQAVEDATRSGADGEHVIEAAKAWLRTHRG